METEEKKVCDCVEECNCGEDCKCDDHDKCSDNCTCNHDEKPIIIDMEDVDGNKVKVEVVATFEDSGKNYAIVNDLDNAENSYIFEIQSVEEGDMLVSIDDEAEFNRLCKVVEELTK